MSVRIGSLCTGYGGLDMAAQQAEAALRFLLSVQAVAA